MHVPTRLPGRSPRSSSSRGASIERDLARLADGTLDPSSRERVQQLVAGSPELQARLREQRTAVAAARSVARLERAPLALRMEHRAFTVRCRRRASGLGVGLAGATGAIAWTFIGLGGGQAALTVAQAATIAARPATAVVAEPSDDDVTLPRLSGAGLPFPYWEDSFGWHATGTRTDRIDGQSLTTVFYRRGAQHIAYTIVAGDALSPVAGARIDVRAGTLLTTSTTGGRTVVTWQRQGHTCVLSGQDVPVSALVKLATWRDQGRIPF
jgi:hypothetical protein